MSKVLIVGCGDIGTALALRLIANAHEVWGIRRDPSGLPPGIGRIAADVHSPIAPDALPYEVDQVVYILTASARNEAAYRLAYVDGLANALSALVKSGASPHRLVYVSSTAVYGQDDGRWVDESSPATPRQFNGRVLLDGERVARAAGIPTTVVRFAGIYGPGRTRLLEKVRRGAGCRHAPPYYTNRIHRDDCAGVLAHILGLERPADVYIGVDCAPRAECEVMGWIADRIGAPAPAPVEGLARGQGKRCSNGALLASGYAFLYPSFEEGYASLIATS